jgi:hypothetical protein
LVDPERDGVAERTKDGHAAPATSNRGWLGRVSESTLMWSGVLFGVVGMVTGLAGFVLAYRAQHEQEVVNLAAYPSAGPSALTAGGLGVRLQLVNQSLRPVIVRSVSLWEGGTKLATATGYTQDARRLDEAQLDPAALTNGLLDFPLNVGAREGRTTALLLDIWNGVFATGAAATAALHKLNRTLSGLGPRSPKTAPFELQIDLAPGGPRRFPLQSLAPSFHSAAEAEPATATATPAWLVSPIGHHRLAGLFLRRTGADAGAVDLVKLDLWKYGSALQRSISRPVIGHEAAMFPLSDLPRGSYTATFQLDGKVIAERSFSLPWHRNSCGAGLREDEATRGPASASWC